jgi:hypothetical protein
MRYHETPGVLLSLAGMFATQTPFTGSVRSHGYERNDASESLTSRELFRQNVTVAPVMFCTCPATFVIVTVI